MEFPSLYFINKNGKKSVWKVWVKDNVKYTHSGLVGGKLTIHQRSYEGKNIGKKNETTPPEQTILVAKREWAKMVNSGREPDESDLEGIERMKKIKAKTMKIGGRAAPAKIKGQKSINIKNKSPYIVTDLRKELPKPMKTKVWEIYPPDVTLSFNPKIKQWIKAVGPLNKVRNYFNLDLGVLVQPKLDGIRCVATVIDYGDNISQQKVILSSNGQKQFPWFKHIREHLLILSRKVDLADGLDGELYIHQTPFSKIQSISAISKSKPHLDEGEMCLHVFDLIDQSGKINQIQRLTKLEQIFQVYNELFPVQKVLIKVPTHKITKNNKVKYVVDQNPKIEAYYTDEYAQIDYYHNKFIKEGYEGIIIRDSRCAYLEAKSGRRSNYIRKYKNFEDTEFKVTGTKLDPGVEEYNFVWECQTPTGKNFRVKPTGTEEERNIMYNSKHTYIGKLLKVRFQGVSEDGIPRFPIGLCFRDQWDL